MGYTGRTHPYTDYQYSADPRKVEFNWIGSEMRIRFRGSTSIKTTIRTPTDAVQFLYLLDGAWLRRD